MKDIMMNGKEQQRAMVLTAVVEGRLTAGEAAELMRLCQRQERRLRHAFVRDGPAALVHGNRGRRPAHTLDAGLRERVAALGGGERKPPAGASAAPPVSPRADALGGDAATGRWQPPPVAGTSRTLAYPP